MTLRTRTRTRTRSAALAAAVLVAASALLGGCAAPSPTPDGRFAIVASFYPVYLDALQLAKDVPGVDVALLAPPDTGCLHDYALTGGDMARLAAADVLVANGDGMEGFLDKVAHDLPDLAVIRSAEGIPPLTDPSTGEPDPHVWSSPKGAAVQMRAIAAGLAAADPAHAALYAANADRYGAQLDALDRRAAETLSPYRGARVLAGHASFLAFARDYGFTVAGIFGLDDGQTIGAGALAAMIADAKENPTAAIILDPQFPAVAGDTIARETGLPECIFDSVVTGAKSGAGAMDDYLDRMDENLDRLIAALEGP